MPIKKDDSGKRWVEMELTVPGTPEQVWQAIATGAGTTAWFTRTTIDEQVGGAINFDFGANGSSTGEVTIWEPPLRFGYVEREWAEGAPPVATEITVTARAGGRCLVRMVHSLFASTDDWDDQVEGFESGWPAFFEVLRLYLSLFAGENAASFFVMASSEAPHAVIWKQLMQTLGLAAADVDDTRTTTQAPERLSGTIKRVQQGEKERYVLLQVETPAPGIAIIGTNDMGNSTNASMALYYYGAEAEQRAAASEPAWQAWFSETFAQH